MSCAHPVARPCARTAVRSVTDRWGAYPASTIILSIDGGPYLPVTLSVDGAPAQYVTLEVTQ